MTKPRSTFTKRQLPPFSLILSSDEMKALGAIAKKEGTSMGAVVRRAINAVIYRQFPGYRKQVIEHEAEAFLDQLAQDYPPSIMTIAKRREFKRRAVELLS